MKTATVPIAGPRLTRRACLALALAAAAAPRAEASTPERVVCLEWTAAEIVLALGVEPIAIGDVQGYRDWVVEPAPPQAAYDVGSRFEPNREVLLALDPDLIVVTEGYGLAASDLEHLAPTYTISPFAQGVRPLDHARREAARVADRLGVTEAGRRLAAEADSIFAECRARLAARSAQPVCVASIFEERTARVYGESGLIGDTMRHLGLRNAWQDEVGSWGFAQVGFEQFARLAPDVRLIVLEPVPEPVQIRLAANSLWNGLPPVRNGQMMHIAPVWPFGGLSAAMRFATLLSDALAPS